MRSSCLCLLLISCGQGATALHVLPRPGVPAQDFYSLPFPSDLRLRPDGNFDLSRYPRLTGQLGVYVQAMDGHIPGAGPGAAVYFRFDAPLDPDSLPQGAADSLDPEATAFIVDITRSSPTYGQHVPVQVSFNADEGRFIGPNWLALLPFPGIPLREHTTYAAILTNGLRALDGGPVFRDPDLSLLLAEDQPADEAAAAGWQRYAPLRAYLGEDGHFHRGAVAGATVFTTQDATSIMLRLRQAVYAQAPVPEVADFQYIRDHDGLCQIYHGTYLSPNFQQGQVPYLDSGGGIVSDAQGVPQVDHLERLRFALSIPDAPMPPAGWPVALYAHGTGGDYQSFINEGLDVRAAYIEQDGKPAARMAMISIDQVLHGPRDPTGSSPDLTFFNLNNIVAARDNPKQGALDDFQLLRLVKHFAVAAAPATGRPIRFDTSHIYFVGHSQGGLTGPLFLSAESEVHAAVLSGAGAVLILSLLNKTEPVDIGALVSGILQEQAGPDHPLLNLLQAYFESSDPNNYGRLFFREPPPGNVPKSIFQTLGVTDHYAPVPNIAALALSMGVQPIQPLLVNVPGLDLTGQLVGQSPVRGNVAGGRATGVLLQFPQKGMDDGHYVLFDLWDARHDWTRFLASDITTGLAQLP